jgi:hypothetical protein
VAVEKLYCYCDNNDQVWSLISMQMELYSRLLMEEMGPRERAAFSSFIEFDYFLPTALGWSYIFGRSEDEKQLCGGVVHALRQGLFSDQKSVQLWSLLDVFDIAECDPVLREQALARESEGSRKKMFSTYAFIALDGAAFQQTLEYHAFRRSDKRGRLKDGTTLFGYHVNAEATADCGAALRLGLKFNEDYDFLFHRDLMT